MHITTKLNYADRAPISEAMSGYDLDVSGLSKLRSLAQVQRLRRRQRLALFGAEHVYIVRSGLAAVEGAPVTNSRSILELLYPGDVVVPGLQAPIPDLGLTATTPAELWRISAPTFLQEMHRDSRLSDLVFHKLNSQRARLQLHVAILAGLASEQRVVALLIEAASRLGVRDSRGISFDMPLSRTEVAEYLALNADTLSRIMSRLTHSNIIERTGRAQMTVCDWDGLMALCPMANAVIALHAP
ncbi:MAG: Crp/Fnr family transcriptional regulator [Hyphomicrobiaceae bacterium]